MLAPRRVNIPAVPDPPSSLFDEIQPETSRQLLLAALEAFAARGYHATTTRDIAQRAGKSPAAVYVHYRAKEDLLLELSRIGHQDVLQAVEAALADAGTPSERVQRFVRTFATWHAEHHALARVIQYEIHALPPAGYEQVRGLRRRIDRLLRAELQRGEQTGELAIDDLGGTTLAILSLCIDIGRWYTPDSRRRPAAVGELYADLALRMVRVSGEGGTRP